MKPVVNSLLAALATLTLLASASAAPASNATVRKADLGSILRHLSGSVLEDLKEGPVALGWLLDQGQDFRRHAQGEALAAAWEEHFCAGEPTEHPLRVLVTSCGLAQPEILGEPSASDPMRAAESMRMNVAALEDVPNIMGNLRALARSLAGAPGKKHIVLYSLDWPDSEQDVESTLGALKQANVTLHCIGRGAYLSDSYWVARPVTDSTTVRKQDIHLAGPDAPFRETPVGWLFSRTGVGNETPAGFGPYGMSRLTAATGGSYYVFYPEPPQQTFCQSTGCRFCLGKHQHCGTWFNESFMRQLAPSLSSRADSKRLAGNPLVAATLKAWDLLEDAECLQTRPPIRAKSGAPVRGSGMSARFRSSLLKTTTCKSRIRWVDRTEKKVMKALSTVDEALADYSDTANKRAVANAELLQAELLALLFNLDQFRAFNRLVEAEFGGDDKPLDAETPVVPADADNCCVRQFRVENLHFCHGVAPIREVDWLQGEHTDERLARVLEAVQRNIDKYHHTPWELSNRHIPLAFFWLPPPST